MNNTPTPAQDLGECLALSNSATQTPLLFEKYQDDESLLTFGATGVRKGDFQYSIWCAIKKQDAVALAAIWNFIRQHGQHFAGLEKENESARETLAKALDADGVNDEPLRMLAYRASNALYWRTQRLVEETERAEAAEARCEELAEKYASVVAKYDDAADKLLAMQYRKHAARARCAELEAKMSILRNAAERETLNLLTRVREAEGLLLRWHEWIAGPSALHADTAAFLAARG